MTTEEAYKIFDDWLCYVEFGDKLSKLFTVVPKYLLPYPIKTIEEALNIVAKDFFEKGDKRTSENIQNTMLLHIGGYFVNPPHDVEMTDREVLEKMKWKIESILANPKLEEAIIKNLKEAQDSWIRHKENKHHTK